MDSYTQERIYQVGLTMLRGVGHTHAKNLVAHCGSAEAVFKQSKRQLETIPGIGDYTAESIATHQVLAEAEEEVAFAQKNQLKLHYFLDASYPRRLKHCNDGPIILYQKGDSDLNVQKMIAVVGTRAATEYGRQFTEKLLQDLKPHQPSVVSGMAYGIDATAHRGALQNKITTLGVMAHGLDSVYPPLHRKMSEEILAEGGSLLSEFRHGTKPDRQNFPTRNRIIAGLCDCVIVIEAAAKGGALITAQLANQYHRDVFALPGRYHDRFSEGCNMLIKSHQAHLFTSVRDLEYIMRWKKEKNTDHQLPLFAELSEDEQKVYNFLESTSKPVELELLCHQAHMPVSKVLHLLMSLELHGLVKSLPGKTYMRS